MRAPSRGRRLATLAAAAALSLAGTGCGAAGEVRVVDAVVAEPIPGVPSAMYLALENPGSRADTLLAVRTGAAGRAELHRQRLEGGMARMEPVSFVEIPARGGIRMAPGGLHVMLHAVSQGLSPGDSVAVEVVLRHAGPLDARAVVVPYAELEGRLGGAAPHHSPGAP